MLRAIHYPLQSHGTFIQTLNMSIPGYDRMPVTKEDWQEYRQEAEQRGHVYQMFVDGKDDPAGDGVLFHGDSEDDAKRSGGFDLRRGFSFRSSFGL